MPQHPAMRWIASLIAVTALAAALYRPYLADLFSTAKTFQAEQLPIGERTLIVAPHPDDETLGGAGVIQKALAAGNQVKVVIMTCGDGYKRAVEENFKIASPAPADYRRLGEARHLESLQAMNHFGVPENHVIFLGYPDGGINGMWETDWDYDRLHKGLNGAVRSPYPFSYEKNAPYCGANIVKNLTEILRDFQPTDIVYPDPNDQHHDHWGTSAFVKYVLTEQKYRAKEWTYLVHRGDFPFPWKYKPDLPLHPPRALSGLDTRWIYLPVTKQEKRRKREAIQKYKTQTKVMEPFLKAFVRENELFGTYTDPVLPVAAAIPDFGDAKKLPYTLFPDAHGDTVRRELEKEADILAVGAVLADGKLNVCLEARAPINPHVRYNIKMRLFQPESVKRFDITVLDSKVSSEKYARNSLELPSGPALGVKGSRLWVSLPATAVGDATAIFLAADTFVGGEQIDKTAWRLVKVNRQPVAAFKPYAETF